jgi:hypothetical protein
MRQTNNVLLATNTVSYGPFSLCVVHKEGLCPSSGQINVLMIMMYYLLVINTKLGTNTGFDRYDCNKVAMDLPPLEK